MSQEERYGTRDRTYSAWHRRLSTQRYVGMEMAQLLSMIDLDAFLYVEYDDGSKEPLALIETARDVGQDIKIATVTKKLARRAHLPAYIVLYQPDRFANPADDEWPDIRQFRVRRIEPEPETAWQLMTADEWCRQLVEFRRWAGRQLDKRLNQELGPVRAAAARKEV